MIQERKNRNILCEAFWKFRFVLMKKNGLRRSFLQIIVRQFKTGVKKKNSYE